MTQKMNVKIGDEVIDIYSQRGIVIEGDNGMFTVQFANGKKIDVNEDEKQNWKILIDVQ